MSNFTLILDFDDIDLVSGISILMQGSPAQITPVDIGRGGHLKWEGKDKEIWLNLTDRQVEYSGFDKKAVRYILVAAKAVNYGTQEFMRTNN